MCTAVSGEPPQINFYCLLMLASEICVTHSDEQLDEAAGQPQSGGGPHDSEDDGKGEWVLVNIP